MQAWGPKFRQKAAFDTHLFLQRGHLSGTCVCTCRSFTKHSAKFTRFFIFHYLTVLKRQSIMSPSFQGGAHDDAVHGKAEYRLFRCVQLRTGYLLCSFCMHGWFCRILQGHCYSGSVLFHYYSCIHLPLHSGPSRPAGTSGTGVGPCNYYDAQQQKRKKQQRDGYPWSGLSGRMNQAFEAVLLFAEPLFWIAYSKNKVR